MPNPKAWYPKSEDDVVARWHTEDLCLDLFAELRGWPEGHCCPNPKCKTPLPGKITTRYRVVCTNKECSLEVTPTSHTLLHHTRVGLTKWVQAAWLTVRAGLNGISAKKLARRLGCSTPAAARMLGIFHLAMAEENRSDGHLSAVVIKTKIKTSDQLAIQVL